MTELKPCLCGRQIVNMSAVQVTNEKYSRQLIWCPKCGRAVVGDSLADGYKRWNTQSALSAVEEWRLKEQK